MEPVTGRPSSEWAEEHRYKLTVIQTRLADEVSALQSGEDWKRYLELQARLHSYSPNNVMLIGLAHARAFADGLVSAPEPTYVAGFHTWRTLGRFVEKGQRGYAVLAPCTYARRMAVADDGRVRTLGRNEAPGEGESVSRHKVLTGFRVAHVFDVSQTTGTELPSPPHPRLLEGEAPPGLGEAVAALVAKRGYSVDTVESADVIDGANGQTFWAAKSVLIRQDMDDAAMVKTLIHEAAHILLHHGPPGMFLPRELKEVEAESVAYVVAASHGMATDSYSFPYVVLWAGEDAAKAVQATQARVANAAREIICASTADHSCGGRVPGVDAALASARAKHVVQATRPTYEPEPAQVVGL